MNLSEKILYCRKKAMLSQEALAERVGVSRQAVSKWETGEAVPEVTKLLGLAQTFGVSTDWLLSEDDPAPEAPVEPMKPAPSEIAHTWVDDVPGMLGNLLRKYGWLFGVRMAGSGLLFLLFGGLIRLISGQFFGGGMMIEGELYVSPGELGGFFGPSDIITMGSNIFGLFSGFVMLIGAGMLIGGIILAVALRNMNRSE